jgi:hypothetical protein
MHNGELEFHDSFDETREGTMNHASSLDGHGRRSEVVEWNGGIGVTLVIQSVGRSCACDEWEVGGGLSLLVVERGFGRCGWRV